VRLYSTGHPQLLAQAALRWLGLAGEVQTLVL